MDEKRKDNSNTKFGNIEIFFLALIAGAFLSLGVSRAYGEFEDFFLWQALKNNPQAFLAQANIEPVREEFSLPVRDWEIKDLALESFTARAVFTRQIDGKILFQKNPSEPFPVASISKLIAADVAIDLYPLDKIITVSEQAVAQEENFGQLRVGEQLRVEDLLHIMLIESSNDAAWTLAEQLDAEEFLSRMNKKARTLGMEHTLFSNVSGVDPDDPAKTPNYSTARDLTLFAEHITRSEPLIWHILAVSELELYRPDGTLHHTLENTNKLLSLNNNIIGGKTGWTPLARGNLLLLQDNPRGNGIIVYVVLGSEDRFGEMTRLIEWVDEAWRW